MDRIARVMLVTEHLAAVLARRRGTWRPLLWLRGPRAEERAEALAGLLRAGLITPGTVIRAVGRPA